MKISTIMTPDPVCVGPDQTLDEVTHLMDERHFRHVPVVADGKLLGVVSNRDLLEATGWLPSRVRDVYQGPTQAREARVRDIMHSPVMRASPDDTVVTVAVEAVVQGIGCLPVMEDGRLIGIVTEMDLIAAYRASCSAGLSGDVDPPVSQMMTTPVETVTSSTVLSEAVELCRALDVRHLPVVQGDQLVGIVSDRDLRRAVGAGRESDYPVEHLMNHAPFSVGPDDRLSTVAGIMLEQKVSGVPVTSDGRVVGIITVTDLLDHCMNHLREPERSSHD